MTLTTSNPKHLFYHITPLEVNAVWKSNLVRLIKYLPLFDGKKIAVVVVGDGLECPTKILSEIGNIFDDVLFRPNDLEARESPSLQMCLTVAQSLNLSGFAFFAHTKGVTHQKAEPSKVKAVQLWTRAMYDSLLADPGAVLKLFESHNVVGSFRRTGEFKLMPPGTPWHYSGTFYWLKLSEVFNRNWKKALVSTHRYGAEAFPGRLYSYEESACVFADEVQSCYNLDYMLRLLARS